MLQQIKKLIPRSLFSAYHFTLAWLGNVLYFFPSRKLNLIGITGTKGKTTTAYFVYQLLEQNEHKSLLSSTVFFAIGDKIERNATKMGMPGRFFMPKFLRKSLRQGTKYAVVETPSEGILQHRQKFLNYNVAVFTGLSPEHVEHHGGFIPYRKAKEKLFRQCKDTHVLNLNDTHVTSFLNYPAKQKWGALLDTKLSQAAHTFKNNLPDYILEGVASPPDKLKIKEWAIKNGGEELVVQFETSLPFMGKFNYINFLLAFATARSLGIPFEILITTIPKVILPPGRMQNFKGGKIPFQIFIDYAHEPLSLRSAIESCRELLPKGKKMICLTGSQGGGRDKWKRKVMGKIAAELCDYVVVGTEDPYQEDPRQINKEVLQGVLSHQDFKENMNCWRFNDRKAAIEKTLDLARPGDIILLAGKGGEKKMCVGSKHIAWDEEKAVRRILLKRGEEKG